MADHGECSDLADESWNKLPDHIQEEIFSFLPVESVYRFRCVCKKWKALLSNKFMNDIWTKRPVNGNPWLVVSEKFTGLPSMAYCFHTRTWKPCFSISSGRTGFYAVHRGSAAGLLLVDRKEYSKHSSLSASCPCPSYVFNPYSRTGIKLPRSRTCIEGGLHVASGIVQTGSDYKVVAVISAKMPHNGPPSTVEIYESHTTKWRIAGHLPVKLNSTSNLFFLNGTFYCLTWEFHHYYILGFSITTPVRMVIFAPLPEQLNNSWWCNLIICGSRLLVAGYIVVQLVTTITIWEFANDHCPGSSSWKEIARMPPSLYEELMGPSVIFACAGVLEWVCFKPHPENEMIDADLVVAYNLSNQSWTRLPRCPLLQGTPMAFEPRPDMSVGRRMANGEHDCSDLNWY